MIKPSETIEAEVLRAARARRLRAAFDQALEGAPDEETVFAQTCAVLAGEGGHSFAWVGKAEHDERRTVRPVTFAGDNTEDILTNEVVWSTSERGSGPTGTAIRTRVPCVMERLASESRVTRWRDTATRFGFAVALSLPLVVEDQVFGALTLLSRHAGAFGADEIALLVGLVRRVTDAVAKLRVAARREAEAVPAEQRFERIFHNTQALIALISPKGVIREINETTLRRARIAARDVVGSAFAELSYHWESEREIRAAIDRCVRRAERVRMEIDAELPEGPAALDMVLEPLVDDGGEVEAILVEAWDVTERRRVEQALRAREQELRLIADHIHDVLWIVDPITTRLVYASPAYETISGRVRPGADARPRDWLAAFHGDDLEAIRLAFMRCVLGKIEVEVACRIVRPDGEVRHVRSTARPVLDADGNIVRIVGVMHEVRGVSDVSELGEPSLAQGGAALRRVS